ncbi:hypothetical protein [Thomasclavelia spiroformis]|uniref:hypothetical protein n=1 Tax=Thomasclavelia spiroformis TaxID=29348 RepID=UPI00241CFEBB|nr:hypothetical protein [Thomasclavelia spiroformis]MBS6685951.1 hypothetical protein [Thomasclavelia spiroformis]
MLNVMIGGLRNFRATIICGCMITFTVFMIMEPHMTITILKDSAFYRLYFLFTPYSLYICLFIFSYFIGVTYLTSLETVINFIHMKTIYGKEKKHKGIVYNLIGLVAPFSEKSLKRIRDKVSTERKEDILLSESEIVKEILIDTLWIEGRIIGTKLYDPFEKMKSDAEFRIGFAIIFIPFALLVMDAILMSNTMKFLIGMIVIFGSIMILQQGLYYYRKAYSMLLHHIVDSELQAPSTLKYLKN